jgi:hypothetical protein
MAKDSVVPPGLGFIWRAKPAVETVGYFLGAAGAGVRQFCGHANGRKKFVTVTSQINALIELVSHEVVRSFA